MNCHWISMGNLLWGGNLAITSNPCERQTIWPRSMKFWYKKRQSIFFKGKFISNLYLLASQRKSLTESIIWGGWPCIWIFIDNLTKNLDAPLRFLRALDIWPKFFGVPLLIFSCWKEKQSRSRQIPLEQRAIKSY